MSSSKPFMRVYLALFTTIMLWSSAFVGIRFTLHDFSPGALALLRFTFASIVMAFVYFNTAVKNQMSLHDKISLMGLGVVGIGLYNYFLNVGEVIVSAAVASFIISLLPLVTIVFAICFLKEKVGRLTWCGVSIAVLGMIILALGTNDRSSLLGELSVFIATIMGAIYTTVQRHFLLRLQPIQVTTYIIWGGTVSLMIFFPDLVKELPEAPYWTTGIVLYMGIFPAALAYLAWSYVIHTMPASKAVVYLYLLPFCSTVMGIVLLVEIPGLLTLVGGVLGLLGAYVASQDKRVKQS